MTGRRDRQWLSPDEHKILDRLKLGLPISGTRAHPSSGLTRRELRSFARYERARRRALKKQVGRLRIREVSPGRWLVVRYGTGNVVLGRSPEGTQAAAEEYLRNYRRYGAWRSS